jgi:hypothetical protein
VRFAYADPPYPGQSKRLYGDHPDYAGEVDHRELVERLEDEFPNGWALSTGAKNLQEVLALCPPVRTLIWHKKAGTPFGDHFYWKWEPVLLRGCRRPDGYPHDLLEALPLGQVSTFRALPESHVSGAKPAAFCHWLFECMGLRYDDEFVDLFPGSGTVTAEWEAWRAQPQLETAEPPHQSNQRGVGAR